jgi:hypothetical protein
MATASARQPLCARISAGLQANLRGHIECDAPALDHHQHSKPRQHRPGPDAFGKYQRQNTGNPQA